MGQVLHGSSQDNAHFPSAHTADRKLGINVKTVAKWRWHDTVEDVAMRPKQIHSTVSSIEEVTSISPTRREND